VLADVVAVFVADCIFYGLFMVFVVLAILDWRYCLLTVHVFIWILIVVVRCVIWSRRKSRLFSG